MPCPSTRRQIFTENIVHLLDLQPALLDIFEGIQHFASLLNRVYEKDKIDPIRYSQHAQHLIYRLLQFAPLSESERLCGSQGLLHLTLVAFTATLLPEYGRQHARYDLLSEKIRSRLRSFTILNPWDMDLRLWILFIVGISVIEASEDDWLLPLVQTTCRELGIRTWNKVQEKLRDMLWIGALHDNPGRRLFDAISQHTEKGKEISLW